MIAGGLNVLLGVVYLGIGTMVAIDLESDIRRRGFSHFGVAWLTIMYTCGGHHLVHGIHLAAEGRSIGNLDVLAVAVGLPAGIIWSWLRVEAVRGGRGDRFIDGTPGWLRAVVAGYVIAALAATAIALPILGRGLVLDTRLLPNVLLFGLYLGIGAALWRGQRRNRQTHGGWSASGLSLMMIYPTCGVMHGVYVIYSGAGSFAPDFHGLWVDWLSVPAGLYFFWAVTALEVGTVRDWTDRFEKIGDPAEQPKLALGESV